MEKRLVKIGDAANLLGCSVDALRKWEKTGELLPARKTQGGTRYYCVADLLKLGDEDAPTVCYARVSSHDQKADLDRQHELLETYCAAKGWRSEVIRDLGSGMNYRKQGLQHFVSVLVDTQDYKLHAPTEPSVGVDFGVKSLAVLSTGEVIRPARSSRRTSSN